jgi:hypothetical protein
VTPSAEPTVWSARNDRRSGRLADPSFRSADCGLGGVRGWARGSPPKKSPRRVHLKRNLAPLRCVNDNRWGLTVGGDGQAPLGVQVRGSAVRTRATGPEHSCRSPRPPRHRSPTRPRVLGPGVPVPPLSTAGRGSAHHPEWGSGLGRPVPGRRDWRFLNASSASCPSG